jgi:hypothetical protein
MDKWIMIAPCVVIGILTLCITAIVLRRMGVRQIGAKLSKDGAEFRIGEDGEKVKVIPRTALADEEIERIAAKFNGHACKYEEYHAQTAQLLEAVGTGVNAIIQNAVEQGFNGPIRDAAPFVKVRLSDYQTYLDKSRPKAEAATFIQG